MYDQIRGDMLFMLLYSAVTTLAMIASCYLLLRQGNAFARDVTPPMRLRRWTAVFIASIALSHVWYMPILFFSSNEDVAIIDLVGGLLDSMTFFPLAIIVLLTMLQDRHRPLWHVAVMFVPLVIGSAYSIAIRSYVLGPALYIYALFMCIGITIYVVRAVRQYGRWLRNNYADLEHKEVWQSIVVLAIILLLFAVYVFVSQGPFFQYLIQVVCAVLVCFLLWRVETLSDLSVRPMIPTVVEETTTTEEEEDYVLPQTTYDNISSLLQKHCIDAKLFLQHDLNLLQLANAVGTNRSYLTSYFSRQGINYNTYINDLRINHFVSLYHETVASQRPFTAHQLAHDSGYLSYSTFGIAFKQRMGQTVTAWMRNQEVAK